MLAAGASVPFYDTTRSYNVKKGTGFGYGKKIGDYRKSESPGPGNYDNVSATSNSPLKPSKNKNGKFGVGYDKFYLVRNEC